MIAEVIIALTVVCQAAIAAPVDVEAQAIEYLSQFGYIKTATNNVVSDSTSLRDALKKFQEFGGIKQTGILDRETRALMRTPRCGVEDTLARFVEQGSKWKDKNLTYRISKYPTSNRLNRESVNAEVKEAFNKWAEVSGLRFEEVISNQAVDIDISFERFEHGDGNPFDGPRGVLAHAFFPVYGGDVHMDDSEDWSVTPFKGNHLLNTLTHELGHSLGLRHSNIPDSVMAPFYKGWTLDLKLAKDDVEGIQALYGKQPITKEIRPTLQFPDISRPAPDFPVSNRPAKDLPERDRPTLFFPKNESPVRDDIPQKRPSLSFPGTNNDSPVVTEGNKPPVSFPGQDLTQIKEKVRVENIQLVFA